MLLKSDDRLEAISGILFPYSGPSTVVKVATRTASVYGFIFSSSVAIHMGRGGSGVDLTEDSPIPEHRYYEPYSTSKIKAEKLVLEANGEID